MLTIKSTFKNIAVIGGVLVFQWVAQYVKLLAAFILGLVNEILKLPMFNWSTGGQPWLLDIVWNSVLSGAVAEGLFTISVIYLNYLLFKKLLKWDVSFTISFVLMFLLFIYKYYVTAISLLGIEYFIYDSTYKNVLFLGGAIVGFILSAAASIYPLYYSYQRFDKNGNWINKDMLHK